MAIARTIFDADSHVTESEDLFTSRVSSRWGDLIPHVVFDRETAEEIWITGDQNMGPAWANAAAGWDESIAPYPLVKADAAAFCYDAAARLVVLDEVGIDKQVLYPNVGGFGGQQFLALKEPGLMLACVRAYNDFLTEWSSVAADRFVPVAALPYWDIPAAVEELHRAVDLGHRGILFPGAPHELDFPYLSDRAWDPLWSAAEEANLPVSFHVGSGDMRRSMTPMDCNSWPVARAHVSTDIFLNLGRQLNDLLFSGVLSRFPTLSFVLVESGIGAVPFILESADYHFTVSNVRQEWPWYDMLPSEYFRRQVYCTVWFERVAPERLIDVIGVNNVLFETDFPHPTALEQDEVGECVRFLTTCLGEDGARRVVHDNGSELYFGTGA
jgi:predicted TIM-barrel fold metal-dependent hydrolase